MGDSDVIPSAATRRWHIEIARARARHLLSLQKQMPPERAAGCFWAVVVAAAKLARTEERRNFRMSSTRADNERVRCRLFCRSKARPLEWSAGYKLHTPPDHGPLESYFFTSPTPICSRPPRQRELFYAGPGAMARAFMCVRVWVRARVCVCVPLSPCDYRMQPRAMRSFSRGSGWLVVFLSLGLQDCAW